ncbi:52 kDa repressor of the inhibitor of the protein kinase [Xenopus tropicalis]|uniref:52 kDa repressor of the inhibitor of the protein kinase n=1 Tax=Xenopus tropicalis TaxID=8364 RepID=Q6P892_XENTR|nr:52 kDa repressor of the inhibitor of the protein kinase [Xenopus tropicalis]AAH61337.1 protein-kinase, interferon-inducible double stranded RNA dependent inhibitor, repressor of (P58 repressor) [Xenopus tropicalis]|eukprot:NP_989053.1 52 kDa repressor of the inhibitor of the protein kinase [Xenopus tropicalis]
MPNFCAAPNCTRKSTQSDLAFFRFPRDPDRRQRWVENCRRADLEDKTPDQLNKHYRLCAQHFEDSMICRSSPYRTVLRENAIPTIFDLTSHLNNPGRRRKRIKELTEEEIRMLKERKYDAIVPDQENHKSNNDTEDHQVEVLQIGQGPTLTPEEKENKDYLKSLFEILILMGKQNIPLEGHNSEVPTGVFIPDSFQALLEYRINSGDDLLRKRFETTAVNLEYCSRTQQRHMLEICESCIRDEILREVRDANFFSVVMEDAVSLGGEEHMPVFVRFIDETNNLREEFLGFLPCEGDAKALALNFHTTMTEKWGLNMEFCRGQAYVTSSGLSANMKFVASQLLEMYPQVVHTLSSTCALNIWLAKAIPVAGVSIVLGAMKDLYSFFQKLPQLKVELERTIKVLFQGNEEKADDYKNVIQTEWISRHDTFEIIVGLLQAFILCLDKITSDNSFKCNTKVTSRAFILSSALSDFDFIVTNVILKNALSFTRAFGKNLQGLTSDIFSAANSLTAVLHSLNEVKDNIEVYHEFWFEEATNLAEKLSVQVKLPSRFHTLQLTNLQPDLTVESFYKDALSVPTIHHIIQGLKDIFSEQHLKALKCLSLVPSVMGQLKFSTSEEHNTDMYKCDLPNPDTLSAELHCWRVKWKHRGKDVELPSNIYESLHLSDIKFFPNVFALLKVLCILPVIKVDNEKFEVGRKRLKAYLGNTAVEHRSCQLAMLNINYDSKQDLDLMVDTYITMYEENRAAAISEMSEGV